MLDARGVSKLLVFLPGAAATAATLLAVHGGSTVPVVRRLAAVGLALVPAGTFVVVALAADVERRRSPLTRRPGLLDAGLLLAVAVPALVLVYAPFVDGLVGVREPALTVLGVTGYVIVPFWLGTGLLSSTEGVEVGVLTLLLSLLVLFAGGVVLGALHPMDPVAADLLVVGGVVGPAVGAGLAARGTGRLGGSTSE